ncbi:hypothetical protein [Vibrio sp. 10N.239.312.D08]|uniref:hypothetical protein n=1 Tax=Vibrio sp. 10N.239.312.D08 TaxID=3229978 RepID=UPI00354F449A
MNKLLPNNYMPVTLSDFLTSKLEKKADGFYRFVFEVPETENDFDLTVLIVKKSGMDITGNYVGHFEQYLTEERYLRNTYYDLVSEWGSVLGLGGTFRDDILTIGEIEYALVEIVTQIKLNLATCISSNLISEQELNEFKQNNIFDLVKKVDNGMELA